MSSTFIRILALLLCFIANVSSYGVPIFNAKTEAESLEHALSNSNIQIVVNILTPKPQFQRLEIAKEFKKNYGKYLKEELKSHVEDARLKNLLVALVLPTNDYYAQELHNAVKGVGTNEDVLIDIICTLATSELMTIGHIYETKFGHNLIDDVKSDTSGDFKHFLVAMMHANSDEDSYTNKNAAVTAAKRLYDAGVAKLGTDEDVFYEIFSNNSYNQLRLVFDEYKQLTGHDIEHAVEKEFSGHAEDALLAFVVFVKDAPSYFAARLNKCIRGNATSDRVVRIIITRSQIDLSHIRAKYFTLYGKSLDQDISDHSQGLYKEALVNMMNVYH